MNTKKHRTVLQTGIFIACLVLLFPIVFFRSDVNGAEYKNAVTVPISLVTVVTVGVMLTLPRKQKTPTD